MTAIAPSNRSISDQSLCELGKPIQSHALSQILVQDHNRSKPTKARRNTKLNHIQVIEARSRVLHAALASQLPGPMRRSVSAPLLTPAANGPNIRLETTTKAWQTCPRTTDHLETHLETHRAKASHASFAYLHGFGIGITLPTQDQTLLHGRLWLPTDTAKGVVLIVHGMGEHSGCFRELAHYLNQADLSVIAFDQRGHGLSQGRQGVLNCYNSLQSDLASMLHFSRQLFPTLPQSIYGHSMGGGLVLRYLGKHGQDAHVQALNQVVITSPWLKLVATPPMLLTVTASVVSRVFPKWTLDLGHKIKPNPDRDPLVDPMCHSRISPRWFMSAQSAGKQSLNQANKFPQTLAPRVHIFHSTEDTLTDARASNEFARIARCQFTPLANFGHGPHITRQRARFFDIVTTPLLPAATCSSGFN